MRKSHRTITVTRHQKDKQSKAYSSLCPIKMIAKLEWGQSTAQNTWSKRRIPINNGIKLYNYSTTTEPPILERTTAQATGGGGLNAFSWYQIIALDSAVVKTQKLFSSHGGFLIMQCTNSSFLPPSLWEERWQY